MFGWGPEKVGKLTVPQCLAYHQALQGLEEKGPSSSGNCNAAFGAALDRLRARTGKDEFDIHDVVGEMK